MKPSFTLLELPIVAAIIAILVAAALPNLVDAKLRAQVADVSLELNAVTGALYRYRVDHNAFPPADVNPVNSIGRLERTELLSFTPIDKFKLADRETFNKNLYLDYRIVTLTGRQSGMSTVGNSPLRPSSLEQALCLSSIGPDLKQEYLKSSYYTVPTLYDCTNGLRSAGELFKLIRLR